LLLLKREKDFIAVVFVGKHDSEKRVRSLFSDVFVSIGAPSAIALFNQEILNSILSHAESNNWQVRRQCYRALAALATTTLMTEGRERAAAACVREVVKSRVFFFFACFQKKVRLVASIGRGKDLCCKLLQRLSAGWRRRDLGSTTSWWQSARLFWWRKCRRKARRALKNIALMPRELCAPSCVKLALFSLRPRENVSGNFFGLSHCKVFLLFFPLFFFMASCTGLLLGHTNDKLYISLHELGFAILAYGIVGNAPDVLRTIVHGITGQSAWEVRVSALAALESVLKVRTDWNPADLELGANLLLFCLADKFVAVRERSATIICSVPLPQGMRACITDAKIALCTPHQETKRAFEFLAQNK
jgi:hypothetical protein